MFRRRRRSTSRHHQPLDTASSQSAQSAATHAFLKSQPSASSLSSAAAAAALRSMTPTPTPLENVQTKRMVQRRASLTSQNGTTGGLRSASIADLRRARSSSSMSVRTFREQSPHRPVTSMSQVGTAPPAPPLPSVPQAYRGRSAPTKRSVSLEPTMHSRTSPKQIPSGRGTSIDRHMRGSLSQSSMRSQGLSTVPELERTSSRNSINFSYPYNSPNNSPTMPSGFPDHELFADSPNTRATVKQTKKKTGVVGSGSPGRSVSSVGAAVAAAQAAVVSRADEAGSPPTTPRRATYRDQTAIHNVAPSQDLRQVSTRPALIKRPTTVPEDYRGEELAEAGNAVETIDSARPRSVSPRDHFSKHVENVRRTEPPTLRIVSTPERMDEPLLSHSVSSPESTDSIKLGPAIQLPQLRQSSRSPGRSARFSNQLAVTESGEHRPPPRPVSPAKSALKIPRKSSLSPTGREGVAPSGLAPSEISDGTSVASDDGSRLGARRKPVKVSFDDEAEIVGVAASPPTSPEELAPESPSGKSAKSKTNWFGTGKKKSNPLDIAAGDEFDEVLKPRPALPSFGSIRAARGGEPQESTQQDFSDNESTASSSSNVMVSGWSFSNDHAVGNIFSNLTPKEHRKQTDLGNTPLPALSDAAGGETNAEEQRRNDLPVGESDLQAFEAEKAPALDTDHKEEHGLPTPDMNLVIPGIASQPTSPGDWYSVPGGFPRTSVDSDPKAPSKKKGKKKARGKTTPDNRDADEESRYSDSVYSDAEQDLDEGDGFGSINAIVDARAAKEKKLARVTTPTQEGAIHQPQDSPDPAFLTQSRVQEKLVEGEVTSVSTHAKAKRPVSIGAYDGSRLSSENSASSSRQIVRQEQEKKRPFSMGPALRKDMDAGHGGEVHGNGRDLSMPRRRMSNGSDSSSSYKRSRRSPKANGMHTMRRTMRGDPLTHQLQHSPSRATSPAIESRPMSSGSGTGTMRATLRGRGPKNGKTSILSSGSSPKAAKTSGPHFKSRFADSDDEDDGYQPRRWQGRFDDSSDEENGYITKHLRPVRGIPRRQGMHDGDSTELEDSSENERHAPAPAVFAKKSSRLHPGSDPGLAAVARSRGVTEEELGEFLRQPPKKRMSGILSRFGIKKSTQPVEREVSKSQLEDRHQGRDGPSVNGTEGSVVTTITSNNGAPSLAKLTKGGSKRASGGGAWPLNNSEHNEPDAVDAAKSAVTQRNGAPLSASDATQQPQTANDPVQTGSALVDGSAADSTSNSRSAQSGIKGEGQHLAGKDGPSALDVVFPLGGRKKRFPALRKAFGMRS